MSVIVRDKSVPLLVLTGLPFSSPNGILEKCTEKEVPQLGIVPFFLRKIDYNPLILLHFNSVMLPKASRNACGLNIHHSLGETIGIKEFDILMGKIIGMRILLIEDDEKIASFVVKGLKQAGMAVDHAADGEAGLDYLLATKYDAAIVDIMLPKMDGMTVIQKARDRKITT